MADIEQILEKALARRAAEKQAEMELEQSAGVTDVELPPVVEAVQDTKQADKDISGADLPIYTAAQGEIDCWHAFQSLCGLQVILRPFDLDQHSGIKRWCKTGYDKKNHRAIFALDDTHYYSIQFTPTDGEPVNYEQAEKVLRKLNEIRGEKTKLSRGGAWLPQNI